jgi:hypothetical protein
MAKTLRTTIETAASYFQAHGGFDEVYEGEPTRPPDGYAVSVIYHRSRVKETTLTGTIEQRTIICRVYHKAALEDPVPEIEHTMADYVDLIIATFLGDFDLGGIIRNIDVIDLEVQWGYQTIQNMVYRLADVYVPMIVDDSATFTA